MAAVLCGDVSPAGRTTTTIYPANFATQRNITDMEMRPHGTCCLLLHQLEFTLTACSWSR